MTDTQEVINAFVEDALTRGREYDSAIIHHKNVIKKQREENNNLAAEILKLREQLHHNNNFAAGLATGRRESNSATEKELELLNKFEGRGEQHGTAICEPRNSEIQLAKNFANWLDAQGTSMTDIAHKSHGFAIQLEHFIKSLPNR